MNPNAVQFLRPLENEPEALDSEEIGKLEAGAGLFAFEGRFRGLGPRGGEGYHIGPAIGYLYKRSYRFYVNELEGRLQVGNRFLGSRNVCKHGVGVASTWYCSTYRPEQKG